jgi:hypothetical protein
MGLVRQVGPNEATATRMMRYCMDRAWIDPTPDAIDHWRQRAAWWRRAALFYRLTGK